MTAISTDASYATVRLARPARSTDLAPIVGRLASDPRSPQETASPRFRPDLIRPPGLPGLVSLVRPVAFAPAIDSPPAVLSSPSPVVPGSGDPGTCAGDRIL